MYIFQGHKGHYWGHAVSKDMLHWRILPPALEPGDGDKGIFSGAAFVNKQGKPTIIYYGVKAGDCMEIDLKIDPGSASRVGLRVRRSPKGREETIIACEPAAGKLILDVTRSSLDKDVRYGTYRPHTAERGDDVRVQKAPFEVPPGDTFKLRVFLDRSIIEVYGDDRQCVTQRIYPSRQDALGVSLFCKGGPAKVISLNAWDMAATNTW